MESKSKTNHDFNVVIENYLKAIWNLLNINVQEPIKNAELARYLKVKPPTVTQMVKKLLRLKLIEQDSKGRIYLSKSGEKTVHGILRKHQLIELFLSQVFGLKGDVLHEEAEVLEHAISERLLKELEKYLNFPQTDYFGMSMTHKKVHRSLAELEVGKLAEVIGIADYQMDAIKVLTAKVPIGSKLMKLKGTDPDLVYFSLKSGSKMSIQKKFASCIIVRASKSS